MHGCNISGNGYAMYVLAYTNPLDAVSAEHNYWGTTDPDAIEDLVYHYVDDTSYARVEFLPFATAEYDIDDSTVTDVPVSGDEPLPAGYALDQNYPNPFNAGTVISFELAASSDVSLDVFNVLGQQVRRLIGRHLSPGRHDVEFDGRDDQGDQLATGVYLYRLRIGDAAETRKMILLK